LAAGYIYPAVVFGAQISDRMNSLLRFVVSQVSKSKPHPSDEDLSPGTPKLGAPDVDTTSSGQRPGSVRRSGRDRNRQSEAQ
jgi:hypothetical protein